VVLDDLCLAYGVFGLTNRPWCHVITVSVTSKIEHINGLHTACMVILWKQIIDSSLSGMRLDFFSSVVLNGLLIIFSITLLVYQSPLFRRSNPVAVIEEHKSVIDSMRIISRPIINMQTLDDDVDRSAATSGKRFAMHKVRSLPFGHDEWPSGLGGSGVFGLDAYPVGLKWAVVTTIFPPTRLIKTLLHLDGWCTVVVADRKGLNEVDYVAQLGFHTNSSMCFVYLSVDRQFELEYQVVKLLPFDSFGRKNIGYVFAIHHGAKVVYDTDDDNEISDIDVLQHWASLSWDSVGGINEIRNWKQTGSNPYPLFGVSAIWPRGLPLDMVKNASSYAADTVSHLPDRGQICVVQSIADYEPDVDAIYRLTNPNYPVYFHSDSRYDACLTAMAPFNAQATIFTEESFGSMLLPITVHGRVSDIWRGYMASATISCSLAFAAPWVTQVRNSHDYLADFEAELPLYQQATAFVDFLAGMRYGTVYAVMKDAYQYGLVEEADLDLSVAWQSDVSTAIRSAAALDLQESGMAVRFRHLLIVMGRGVHLRPWKQLIIESPALRHVDLILGVFDESVDSLDCPSSIDRVECVSCAGTSWTTGRNYLTKLAFRREQKRSVRYTFWTFADGDLTLRCQLKGRESISDMLICFELYDNILKVLPMGSAVVTLLGTNWWSLQEGAMMVGLQAFDAAWNSFRREAVPLLLPYQPDLDQITWWSSQAIFWNRVMCFAPLYAVSPLSVLYDNPEHNDYPKNARNMTEEWLIGNRLMGALASIIQHAPSDYPDQLSASKVRSFPIQDVPFDPLYEQCSREYAGLFYSFALSDS
jgi:hypothetical protein